ncbi:hypothetical protein [Parahalioglobus pacificus]|uniref:Uncharacterized protein n=1 Tax=Parahalioglobus pacificus TaxID=930806 RepID=A0A918XF23_9GAMM|nr:hypothetical protein [Halioglobus pacificus]GHD29566.1 hypothetical protein GCM10007053_10320 [Halioglobus pacificus]
MDVLPSHIKPECKQGFIDTWCQNGRIAVPPRSGGFIDLEILTFAETALINGKEAHLIIEGRTTRDVHVKHLAVAFKCHG